MTEMVSLVIDGREVEAEKGSTIMEAARNVNIQIPNLCSNEELAPYAACRICMVEITHGKRKRLVTSCIYEVAEGLVVETDTEKVRNVRRLVIELLLTRNPKHPVLRMYADQLGVEKTRFEVDVKGCILCGQCIRTCREVVGVAAISYEGRGPARKISTPFNEAPPDCIACGSCAYICPVDVIPMKEENGVRTIWNTDFPMRKCEKCGMPFMPEKQIEHFKKIANLTDEDFKVCNQCR